MRDSQPRLALWSWFALLLVTFATTTDAHRGITSRYTYNDDVYPILRQRCGACHADGGPTPMSLLTYQDNGGAVAWAESIRQMLISETMPPWYVDPTGPAVKHHQALTPREMDIIVTWATGGTPQGDVHKTPDPSTASPHWALGPPDATLTLERRTLGAGTIDASVDLTMATNFTRATWVKALDVLPGTPSIVRQATISVEGGQTLAVWEPGDEPVPTPGGTAFLIPSGATLRAHVRYKKEWRDEQVEKSDTSIIGFYFTDAPLSGRAIETVAMDGKAGETPGTFGTTLTTGGRVLAIRPQVDQRYMAMEITATTPTGRNVPLLKLRGIRPEWPRRYWLVDPVELPTGTRIDVTTKAGDPDSAPIGPRVTSPLRVSLDIVRP